LYFHRQGFPHAKIKPFPVDALPLLLEKAQGPDRLGAPSAQERITPPEHETGASFFFLIWSVSSCVSSKDEDRLMITETVRIMVTEIVERSDSPME
jgi:hypothetical protein